VIPHPRRSKIREAKVQFELYRRLANVIERNPFRPPVEYAGVEPEWPVGEGIGKPSADLVLMIKLGQKSVPFLVLETKRRTFYGVEPFKENAIREARVYAEKLNAPYYATTDSRHFLLFRTPDRKIGEYRMELDEQSIERLLKDLANLHANRISELTFRKAENPYELVKQGQGAVRHKAWEQLVKELRRKPTSEELNGKVKELWEVLRSEVER